MLKKICVLTFASCSISALAFAGAPATSTTPVEVKKAAVETKSTAATTTTREMAAPVPAPEIVALAKGMTGTWKCDGKSADMGKPTMHPIKATMVMKSDLGGHFLAVTYDEAKSKENPMPFAFKESIGWDAGQKKYVRSFMDNMGGMAMFTAAAPAEGVKVMEWTGDANMGGQKVPMKDTITTKSDKEVAVDVTMQGQDGNWVPVANMVCSKK